MPHHSSSRRCSPLWPLTILATRQIKHMRIFETIIGILFFPIIWIYDRLIKGKPSSPPEFWLFVKELSKRGVSAQLQMQELQIEGISGSAIVVLDPDPSTCKIVNLFKCDSVETANRRLAELEDNPAMCNAKKRDRYLMSATFVGSNDQLGVKITEAFESFELPPNTSLDPAAKEPHAI